MIIRLSTFGMPEYRGYQTIDWPWDSPPRIGDHVTVNAIQSGIVWRIDWHVSDGSKCVIVHLRAGDVEPDLAAK